MAGPPGVGKTTVLVAMQRAANDSDGWSSTEDQNTREEWIRKEQDLGNLGKLPEATSGGKYFKRYLGKTRTGGPWLGPCRRLERRAEANPGSRWPKLLLPILYLWTERPVPEIELGGIDYFGRASLELQWNDEIRQDFASARGLFFLYDWQAAHRDKDEAGLGAADDKATNYDYLESLVKGLRDAHHPHRPFLDDNRLPIPLAIGIPKIDDPKLFDVLNGARLIGTRWEDGREVAYIRSQQKAFELLVDRDTRKLARKSFARVKCFPLTAVGFYLNERNELNRANPCNVWQSREGSYLRRTDFHPYNVLEPLLWLHRNMRPAA